MKTPVGYTNLIPGDERTCIVEVMEYNEGHLSIQKRVRELEAEILAGRTAERHLAAIMESCKHEIFHDKEGFPYDTRYCNICGAQMGLT